MKKHLVERLMAQANREANELADLLEEAATAVDALKAERDAAFAMSQCQCGTDEACANLAKLTAERDAWEKNLHEQIDLLNQVANERDALKVDAERYRVMCGLEKGKTK